MTRMQGKNSTKMYKKIQKAPKRVKNNNFLILLWPGDGPSLRPNQ
jgi:hypothetical protein